MNSISIITIQVGTLVLTSAGPIGSGGNLLTEGGDSLTTEGGDPIVVE